MIIGVVSDVHGNAEGLATALDRMGDVDVLLCAGDIVEEFRFSNAAVEILRDRDAICVLGNHDLGFLGPHGERARASALVDPALVEWLAAQPRVVHLEMAGARVVMAHSSPLEQGMPYLLPHSPELERLSEVDADFIILGHTHQRMDERIGNARVVNPGSVGQARDPRNGRHLSYAVLDTTDRTVRFDDYVLGTPSSGTMPAAARTPPADGRTRSTI